MKALAVIAALVALVSVPALADRPSSTLRISAIVPPPPCDADRSCEAAAKPLPAAATRVIIDERRVAYVGSMPIITVAGELKTVLL